MLERLSVDFVRKVFYALTNGNAQIKFHTICMHNQDREKAANRPVEFGLKLLGYNVWYRLPGLRNIPIGRQIGKTCLTKKYLRLPVEDLSSEILENPSVICDITHSLFLPVVENRRLYQQVEKQLCCPGFEKMRLRLENPCVKIEEIYKQLSRAMKRELLPNIELKMAADNLMPNRYIIRLLDIAAYHKITIHFVVDSSYPKEFYERLLRKNHIDWDTLAISCEHKQHKQELARTLRLQKYGVVSADFNHFIRPLHQMGGRSIYYRAPVQLMRDVRHPKLSEEFRERYDAICGAKVFSGKKRASFAYELGFLCAGPLLHDMISFVRETDTVCYAVSDSPFARVTQTLCTTDGRTELTGTAIRVVDTGMDREGFKRFMQSLKNHNPQVSFQTASLDEIFGADLSPLSSLFSGEEHDVIQGALDFCREYTVRTGETSIPLSDARSLYAWGYHNMDSLVHTSRGIIAAQAAI